jgi:hypothetical protein
MIGQAGGVVGQKYDGENIVRAGGWKRKSNSQAQMDALHGTGLLGSIYTIVQSKYIWTWTENLSKLSQRNMWTRQNKAYISSWSDTGRGITWPSAQMPVVDMVLYGVVDDMICFTPIWTDPAFGDGDILFTFTSDWIDDDGKVIYSSSWEYEWDMMWTINIDDKYVPSTLIIHGLAYSLDLYSTSLFTYSLRVDPAWWSAEKRKKPERKAKESK